MTPLCYTPSTSHTAGHGCSRALCVQLVEPLKLTLAQLKEYDGSDKKRPIYLAIRGVVFNVSRGEATQPFRLARAARQLQKSKPVWATVFHCHQMSGSGGSHCASQGWLRTTEVNTAL